MNVLRQVLRRSLGASIITAGILIVGYATTSSSGGSGVSLSGSQEVPSVSTDTAAPIHMVADTEMAADTERHAVVVDIDGVLTQYTLLDYGPTNGIFLDLGVAYPRRDAALLMNLFYRKGYDIVYLAGRPANMKVNGMSMVDTTLKWLRDEGFPTEPDRTTLLLQDGPASVTDAENPGQAMADYMGTRGTDLVTGMLAKRKEATKITYDYGYCDSDVVVKAFLNAGIQAGHIYTIGNKGVSRLGFMGSHAIIGPESNPGFTRHIREFVIPEVAPRK